MRINPSLVGSFVITLVIIIHAFFSRYPGLNNTCNQKAYVNDIECLDAISCSQLVCQAWNNKSGVTYGLDNKGKCSSKCDISNGWMSLIMMAIFGLCAGCRL